MYSLNMPVSALRTKMRQEFERHRYVKQIGVVDMLLFQSHAEYQVRLLSSIYDMDLRHSSIVRGWDIFHCNGKKFMLSAFREV